MKNVEWLWRNSACARWYIVANIFLCSVSIGLNLFFIWLSKSLVDVVTITHDRQHLVMCGILLFLSVILRVLVNALKAHMESISFYRTAQKMWISVKARRACLHAKIQRFWFSVTKKFRWQCMSLEKDVPFISAVFHILSKMHEFSIEA